MSFSDGPWDLNEALNPVLSRFKRFVPRRLRSVVRRYRTWVPILLAIAALSLIVVGIMNPAPPLK